MKHSHIILIAIVGIAILIAALLMPKETAQNADQPPVPETPAPVEIAAPSDVEEKINLSAALVIDSELVEPLCFVNRSAEDAMLAYPVTGCSEEDGLIEDPAAKSSPFGPQFVSTAYISESDEMLHGLIGYRYLGEVDGHKAVWLVENSGGSGIFTTLVLLDLIDSEEGKLLKPFKGVAFGDRCNGGITDAQVVNGKLVYDRDMTPYDLMSLAGDPDREILQSAEMGGLPACSVCCYGKAHFEGEDFAGVMFDKRLPEGIAAKTYTEGSSVEKCFDDQLVAAMKDGKFYLNADDFAAFVSNVEQSCLKPAGGAE